jgi:hypothetical protein
MPPEKASIVTFKKLATGDANVELADILIFWETFEIFS